MTGLIRYADNYLILLFMDNSINLSLLIPLIPFGMTLLIFLLLRSFNKTINRLTKPISYLAILSILSTSVISLLLLLQHNEANIPLSNYLSFFEGYNLEFHVNELTERIIIFIGLIFSSILLFSVFKLPRRKGYVMYVVNLNLIASVLVTALLILDLH
tara:strand:+ start:5388 stop:5861 length:474 start_codon:yes stop_codon:yes gene_type:complete